MDFFKTCSSPINIAVIKYWGKRDENLILPTNSSISGTLNQKDLRTKTSILFSKDLKEDLFFLNKKEEKITNRIKTILCYFRLEIQKKYEKENFSDYKFLIVSENNFATAAGLASSASGLSCLTFCLKNSFNLKISDSELSIITRRGSGSACRSLFGGFVERQKGDKSDGSDSISFQLVNETYWKEMRILILVVSGEKKKIDSSNGMKICLETKNKEGDSIMKKRIENAEIRTKIMENAIKEKNFQLFAKLTIEESEEMHQICEMADVFYLNEISKKIIKFVKLYNEYFKLKNNKKESEYFEASFTFDAGPNGVLYLLEKNEKKIFNLIKYFFCGENLKIELEEEEKKIVEFLEEKNLKKSEKKECEIIRTSIGGGPFVIEEESEGLIDLKNKQPKFKI